jgi:hypothetical protein
MVDIKGVVESGQTGLEKLVASIPGYKGYKDKDVRRDADRVLRLYIAGRLDEQRRRLSDLQLQLISGGQLDLLDDLEGAVKKIQILADRIKVATYGYTGFFDVIKVKEDQLDAIYDFDNALLNEVEKISAAVNQVKSALDTKEDVAGSIANCVTTAQEANYTFDHREEVILRGDTTSVDQTEN